MKAKYSEAKRKIHFVLKIQVNVGIDIMDIQNVDDKQFTVTLNAFFVLRWTDRRIAIRQDEFKKLLTKGKEKKFFSSFFTNFLKFLFINDQ